ncbi:MAG: AGE family epimerase/isomerase [Bacteroidota bacterium]
MYSSDNLHSLANSYLDDLLENTLPFWITHAVDWESGGFVFNLNKDGSWLSTDKSIWIHGRFCWLLATVYATVEQRPHWLALARHGIEFLEKYGFDQDGRMFFSVTREGKPLRKRRYIFSECFMLLAYTSMAKATNEAIWRKKAEDLFRKLLFYLHTPGSLTPKINPAGRVSKSLAIPMILLNTAQNLREVSDDSLCQEIIDQCIAEIRQDFLHPDFKAVMETVGPTGEFQNTFEGRLLNPGHALEAAWFVLHEAKIRTRDPELIQLGLSMLDWSWEWGWDQEHGGIIYYRDVKHLPPTEYWHDMKFWWPQNEAIIATLLAWWLTGDSAYAQKHQLAHNWAYRHFPDHEYGEWFGYLHRDGRLSTELKGNQWKGPFHLPRMQWYCWQLLSDLSDSALQSE